MAKNSSHRADCMEDSGRQQIYKAEQELSRTHRDILALISRIYKDIQRRTSKENVALLKIKLKDDKLTASENLDNLLHEYIELVDNNCEGSATAIEDFKKEVNALKHTNEKLKAELQRAQQHSEQLDELNAKLGGPGVSSNLPLIKIDTESEERTAQKINLLETQLRETRKELSVSRTKVRTLSAEGLRYYNSSTIADTMTVTSADILKRVQGLVPMFSGEPSERLHTEVHRFLEGVNLAMEGLNDTQKLECLKMVKQRLSGDAYELLRQTTLASANELGKILKQTYLTTRTLDWICLELWRAAQRPNEDIKAYARRIKDLGNMHKLVVKDNYPPNTDTTISDNEIAKHMRKAFVTGIRDKAITQ